VKKLIRSTTTREFLTPIGDWTGDVQRARAFSDYAEAATLGAELQLKDVEVYYCLEDNEPSNSDFALPLR
jgi:hypothetical protein